MFSRSVAIWNSYLFIHIVTDRAGSSASSVTTSTLTRCLLFEWPNHRAMIRYCFGLSMSIVQSMPMEGLIIDTSAG